MTSTQSNGVSRRNFLGAVGLAAGGVALGATTASAVDQAATSDDGKRSAATYRVTVANLTGGQPLTPPLVALHRPGTGLFSVGEPASEGIQQLAENGNLEPLTMALSEDDAVGAFAVGDTGPLVPAADPGETGFAHATTLEFGAARDAAYFSYAAMLVATNDGFAGLDTVALPETVGESATHYAAGFDAGTEINTEDFADLVPPAQALIGVSSDDEGTATSDPDLAEDGVIHPHPGVVGGSDLVPEVHGWREPVVMVHVERTG